MTDCPVCQSKGTRISDSRPVAGAPVVRRRRRCVQCDYRFTTYEVRGCDGAFIVFPSGRVKPFRPEVIAAGVADAAKKELRRIGAGEQGDW